MRQPKFRYFEGHTFHKCAPECAQPGHCAYCDGGLALCTVCGGAEGSMPQVCPGFRLDHEVLDMIYAGYIDFDGKEWVSEEAQKYYSIGRLLENDPTCSLHREHREAVEERMERTVFVSLSIDASRCSRTIVCECPERQIAYAICDMLQKNVKAIHRVLSELRMQAAVQSRQGKGV